ncbi:MAG: hypothetical protein Q7S07_00915 [Candidatus Omnitrophota bacterium]|nr:hypothetical protein [Candidatus Omnitrophota bacterium]
MSKIIDTISNPFKKEKLRSSAQEEIAKIYLKVSDKSKSKSKHDKLIPKLPWGIAALALILAVATLFFKSSIDVKIRILGELPSMRAEEPDKFGSLREKGLYLIKGSEPNLYLVKDFNFAGDARAFSKVDSDTIVLCNSKGSGWANYEIILKEPLDLNKLDIKYAAKGERGEEFLAVAIVDSDNRAYRLRKDISSELSKEWQTYTVNFKPLKNAIDLSNITTIRFEFGGLTAGNSPMATIFLKDIRVTKTRRMEV